MSNDALPRENTDDKVAKCFGWLLLFGVLGVSATVLVTRICTKWSDQCDATQAHALMLERIEQIRQGEVKCLVQPTPSYISEVLADAKCAANVHEVYLGGSVSDEQLGRLRELPNLKCIVLLFAENTEPFLERLQGMTTLEVLNLEQTSTSRRGIEFISTFPNLKSFSLIASGGGLDDFESIRNHASLENLVLGRLACDDRLVPLLQSMPRLQSVTIEDSGLRDEEVKEFEELLQKALPNCRCSVRWTR